MTWRRALAVVIVVAAVAFVTRGISTGSTYELTFVMPTADNTFVGANVTMGGQKIGRVDKIGTRDGRALVTVDINHGHAPLRAGTKARIAWESLIGARVVELLPGPPSAPALASGRLITGSAVEAVEIDDLLASLDAPTRHNLQTLVAELDAVLKRGGAQNTNAMIHSAAPLVRGMAEVVSAVGQDGPAIQELVDQLHEVTSTLANRQQSLAASVQSTRSLTSTVARRQTALSNALNQLPETVRSANATLAELPKPVSQASELLRELKPATSLLPRIAEQLAPTMKDLRSTSAELGPTLRWLAELLNETPGLLTASDGTIPEVTRAAKSAQPMTSFLRPYTPELVGWLTNWTSIFGSQTASGNYARALITVGASSFNNNPGTFLPGQKVDPTPAPGSIVGQAWDANGDQLR